MRSQKSARLRIVCTKISLELFLGLKNELYVIAIFIITCSQESQNKSNQSEYNIAIKHILYIYFIFFRGGSGTPPGRFLFMHFQTILRQTNFLTPQLDLKTLWFHTVNTVILIFFFFFFAEYQCPGMIFLYTGIPDCFLTRKQVKFSTTYR